jgi:hypothetical protein
MLRAVLVVTVIFLGATNCLAWDPWGDVTHPDRIVRNAGRELNNAGRTIDRWRLEGQAQAGAPALEQWFIQSRNSALSGGVWAVPPTVRQQLQGVFDNDVFNRARYKIGDAGVANLANLSIRYGDAQAVVLIDVIVFANEDATNDIALWAHELKHVQQFRDWGTRNFSIRYLRSWNSVENEANAVQNMVAQRLASNQSQGSSWPGQWPSPSMGSFCSTAIGRFGPGPMNPLGSPCRVMGPQGIVLGRVTQ